MRNGGTVTIGVCALVVLLACEQQPCGEGANEVVDADGARFCVAETRAVIEGGITCPAELPFEVLLEEGLVCTSEPASAEDLPPEVCATLGGCTAREPAPSADAGLALLDGATDAGTAEPGHGRWASIAASGPARSGASCATDSSGRLVVMGGWAGPTGSAAAQSSDARRFDPGSGDWTELPMSGRPSARTGAALVAFESDAVEGLFVFGGDDGDAALGDAHILVGGSWSMASTSGAPSPRDDTSAVWTGSEVLVWGGLGPNPLGDGAAYDPATDRWHPLPTEGAPTSRGRHAAVWTGSEMIVWGGMSDRALADGAAYDPAADRWRPVTSIGAPTGRQRAFAEWTGSIVLIWGGSAGDGRQLADGALYDPRSDRWQALPEPPPERTPVLAGCAAGWNGERFVIWGSSDATELRSTGAALDPTTRTWSPLSSAGEPSLRLGACAVAGPVGLYLFGGRSLGAQLSDGALHAP